MIDTETKHKKVPRPKTLSRYVELAEYLAEQHPNKILPCVTWLRHNGYTNLYQYMRAHPNAFNHITQEVKVKMVHQKAKERHLKLIEKLTNQNKGILPSTSWLAKHGYSNLVNYMAKYPKLFKHVKQETISSKVADQYLKSAEELARNNNGTLPGSSIIIQKTGWGLYKFMRRNPNMFRHLYGFSRLSNKKWHLEM